MTESFFFGLYLPAVEKAIENDSVNSGYHVKLPIDYVDDKYFEEVDSFVESHYEKHRVFFDLIAIYFDAKSHYFKEIDGESITSYRERLVQFVGVMKNKYRIQ